MPRHDAEAERTVRCEVENFNFSPKGGVEGLLVLVDGDRSQIAFPPHVGSSVARAVKVGQVIEVTIRPEPASPKGEAVHPVYELVALGGVEAERLDEAGEQEASATAGGVVARLNFAKHGEPNGVVLDSGDFIHLKPDGMRQVGLKIGDRVEATGEARPMELGHRVVEAVEVNGVRLKGKPKHH